MAGSAGLSLMTPVFAPYVDGSASAEGSVAPVQEFVSYFPAGHLSHQYRPLLKRFVAAGHQGKAREKRLQIISVFGSFFCDSSQLSCTMPPRRRKAAKDAEEDPAEQEKSRIEIADDTGDNDSLSSEKECDDDPVMKTYDVFISDQLKDHIYLLQYPIRNPQEQYYDDSAPFEARIKPQEGTLELDVPLDTNNFSLIRGEKFAGQSSDSGIKREAKVLDRQRLSGISQPNQANYFVATIRGGILFSQSITDLRDQMHLSQVKSTIQLRPSFHYFDALIGGEKRKKAPADDSAARQPRAVQVYAPYFLDLIVDASQECG